ncbi:MAG: S8 family serine peptidase [Acidobacteriota bacterium]
MGGLLASAGSASAQTDKVDRALRDAIRAGARTENVIISVRPGYLGVVRRSLQAHGDRIRTSHESIAAVSAEIHVDDIAELARQPWVEGVSLDALVYASDADRVASSSQPAGYPWLPSGSAPKTRLRESLGLSAAASPGSPAGEGVVVALIDSGISPSQDLDESRIAAFFDFTRAGCAAEPQQCAARPFDDLGHGTHVAGLIGSSGALSHNLYQGVAPAVKFVGLKVLKADGSGRTSDVITAIEFVTSNRQQWGGQVIINLSLGHTIFTPAVLDPLVRAVERASAAGIVVVVAAGNNAKANTYSGITSPANAPSALTTGAVETNRTPVRPGDWVADFSARGPTWFDAFAKPDFVAPGSRLISNTTVDSTLFKATGSRTGAGPVYQIPDFQATGHISIDNAPFLQLSGTSMAAGVASGVVALVLEANRQGGAPSLTPNAVKAILQYTATAVTANRPDTLTQGVGQINAHGAVALATQLDTTVPLGGWWLKSGVDESTQFGLAGPDGCALPNCRVEEWSRNVIWGSRVVAGDLVYRKLLIWAGNMIWGTDVVSRDDSNVQWGTARQDGDSRDGNLVWGTRLAAGAPVLLVACGDQSALNAIMWGTASGAVVLRENIVWGGSGLWGNNLVPGRVMGVRDGEAITWSTVPQSMIDGDNILWGTNEGDNILWGTWDGDNILWGTSESDGDVIVMGTTDIDGDNILWGTWDGDNILWGTSEFGGDNILWGTWDGDNILWGTWDLDNILWGTVLRRSGAF